MSVETALWLVGGAAFPVMGWGCWLTLMITEIRRTNDRMTEVIDRADSHDFGNAEIIRIVADNTRAMQALSHYIQWLATSQTGQAPPPPL
jgi:hypothetical protein